MKVKMKVKMKVEVKVKVRVDLRKVRVDQGVAAAPASIARTPRQSMQAVSFVALMDSQHSWHSLCILR